jgi:hypothetical protein
MTVCTAARESEDEIRRPKTQYNNSADPVRRTARFQTVQQTTLSKTTSEPSHALNYDLQENRVTSVS